MCLLSLDGLESRINSPNSSLVAQLKISEASEKLEVQEKARDAEVPLVLTVMCQRGRSLDANKPLVAQPKDFRSS